MTRPDLPEGFVAPLPAYETDRADPSAPRARPVVEEATRPGWVAQQRRRDLHGATGWGRPPEAVLNAVILFLVVAGLVALRGIPVFSWTGFLFGTLVFLRVGLGYSLGMRRLRPRWTREEIKLR